MSARRRARGFTVLELAMALSIAAILARISVPILDQFMRQARAAKAAADYSTIRTAAFASFESNGRWPEERGPGVTPPELVPYLPRDFSFDRRDYVLDWEHWLIEDGGEGQGVTGEVVALSVVTDDVDLGRAVSRVLGTSVTEWSAGDHYTLMIQSTLQSVDSGARWQEQNGARWGGSAPNARWSPGR